MWFAYQFVPNHGLYKLQEWIEQLVLKVWCKAEPGVDFDANLLCDELKNLTIAIQNNPHIKNDPLFDPINKVYVIMQGLDVAVKQQIEQGFRDNNSIEELCCNLTHCNPMVFKTLKTLNEELASKIQAFFTSLYEDVLDLADTKKALGADLKHHFEEFGKLNKTGKCAFCGLENLESPESKFRSAYDHYLPKATYPFTAINFKNLAPICEKCNSKHKLQNDPIWDKNTKTRRKTFYPFSTSHPRDLEIHLSLKTIDLENLKTDDIDLDVVSNSAPDQVKTWKEVFGIVGRYKDKCTYGEDREYWIKQVFEYSDYSEEEKAVTSKDRYIEKIIRSAESSPWAHGNFLKAKFLEACKGVGAFR